MPITESAKKALRRDRKRQEYNRTLRTRIKTTLEQLDSEPNQQNLTATYSVLDRAAKKGVIHPNKAARLKSSASKKLSGETVAAPTKKTASKKKPAKKAPAKKKTAKKSK